MFSEPALGLRALSPPATTRFDSGSFYLWERRRGDILRAADLATMISGLDHLVLTVEDIPRTVSFYTSALGMRSAPFGEGRMALLFGQQKINLHQKGQEFEPKAGRPTPGSADLCFISDVPLGDVLSRLKSAGVPIVEGPVQRAGARGPILSVYFRDPDLNLIEISTYPPVPPSKGKSPADPPET